MLRLAQFSHTLLFPGVIVHELAHYLACVLLGVRVTRTKFWGAEKAFIEHESPGPWRAVLITLAPFVLNNFVALLCIVTATIAVRNLLGATLIDYLRVLLFYWLGLSFAYHSFPSDRDAENALGSLVGFYLRKLSLRDGLFNSFVWLLTAPIIFIPLAAALFFTKFVISLEELGLLWFILLVLGITAYLGV